MNPPRNHMSLNINKSLRTRFTLRFIRALKKIQDQEKSCTKNGGGGNYLKFHKVKVAADASMAAAVGPRRAWSRALLSRVRLSWRRRGLNSRKESVAYGVRKPRIRGVRAAESQSQTKELRSLVPGGEAMDMHNLLDETAHYIMCLTTQVKVMRNIVNYCSNPVEY